MSCSSPSARSCVFGKLLKLGHWDGVGTGPGNLTTTTSVRCARQARSLVAEISITRAAPSARFVLPSDRSYLAPRHVWARLDDGVATVGVSAPLGEMLWFAPEVRFWAVERVEVGDTLATVQGRSGRTVTIGSPVAGSVVKLNSLLERAPHALLAQPYGGGWVACIAPERWERDQARLVTARAYRARLDSELPIGRDFCFGGALLPAPLG